MPWHSKEQIDMLKVLCKEKSCWSCGKCDVIMTKINERFGKLEWDVGAVQEEVSTLKEKQKEVEEELKTASEWRTSVEAKMANNTNNVKAATMNEAEQRLNNRKNVVLYGVPESSASTAPERISHDRRELSKVLNTIDASEQVNQDGARRITRVGKKNPNKPRPLRVELKSEDQRDELLDKARVLREDEDCEIRMKPDLTKMQRDKDEELRQEVDELNQKKPTDEDGPFHWRIAGPPGQLRKAKVRGAAPPRRDPRRSRSQAVEET